MIQHFFYLFVLLAITSVPSVLSRDRWTEKQAHDWRAQNPWFIGCNFIPSTAVNTLEMWQSETFDPITIDKELGYAQNIGFNIIRVFLHHLVWKQNPAVFKERLDKFLQIADSHKIKTMFVLFDDCWNPEGYLGTQPDPIPGVHNSRWVQAPGEAEYTNPSLFPMFQNYVSDIIGTFKLDKRVILWDIYNEPGNSNHGIKTLLLLTSVFKWARDANPSQPISAGVWNYQFQELNAFQLAMSDITTFHVYDNLEGTQKIIESLRSTQRPMICTEYMARTINSNFITHVPLFFNEDVGAINWGLVSGKTQTIYPWNSPEGALPPKIWFHDVFHPDGTPFDSKETDTIRQYSSKASEKILI